MNSLDGGQKEEGAPRSEQYKKLLDLGLVEQVAAKLDIIYTEGLVKVFLSLFFDFFKVVKFLKFSKFFLKFPNFLFQNFF